MSIHRLAMPRLRSIAVGLLLATAISTSGANASDRAGIRDAEIERILHGYSDPIFKAAGLEPQAVNIYILNDPTLNAFVTGGQNVFLHTGMITELDTPNELKGVIAHETGHIAGSHLARGPEAAAKAQVPMLIGMLAGVAAIAAGAPDLGLSLLVGSQTFAQREYLSYSRTQEASADQAGVKYLNAIQQSPRGSYKVFSRFADEEALSGTRQDPFVRSHPLSRDRSANLLSLIEASPYKDKLDTPKEQHDYDMMRAKLRGFIEPPEVVFRRYPFSDNSAPARYARAAAFFRSADLDRAIPQIDSLIAEEPENGYFWELKGQILVESSQPEKGVPCYRKAAQFAPNEPLIHAGLGSALLATEDDKLIPEAMKHLKIVLRSEPENGMAWYYLANAFSRSGDEAMAALATAERFYALQRFPQAMSFAQRALPKLKDGTRDWQRANDIISASQNELASSRQNRR